MQWLILLRSPERDPRLHFFLFQPTQQQLTQKFWTVFWLNFPLFHSSPPWFLGAIRITKITKPIFQLCLEKFYFGFTSTNVKIPLGAAFVPCHVLTDFSFMPFWLETSCWRILFCACQRTSMFFMTFMNVTSLGTCCLSGRVAAKTWSHCDQNFQFWGWLIHQLGSINWQSHLL